MWAFADKIIDSLPLDAAGQVPSRPADCRDITLQQVLVHVTADLARHAGHADILRDKNRVETEKPLRTREGRENIGGQGGS